MDSARALLEASFELGAPSAVVAHSFGAAATGIALAGGLLTEKVVVLPPPLRLSGSLMTSPLGIALPPRAARAFRRTVERHAGADPPSLSLSAWPQP